MDEQRRSEIDRILLKRFLAKDIVLGEIASNAKKRNIGNLSKETSIPLNELLEYVELIIREIFDDQMAKLKKLRA